MNITAPAVLNPRPGASHRTATAGHRPRRSPMDRTLVLVCVLNALLSALLAGGLLALAGLRPVQVYWGMGLYATLCLLGLPLLLGLLGAGTRR